MKVCEERDEGLCQLGIPKWETRREMGDPQLQLSYELVLGQRARELGHLAIRGIYA